MAKNRYVNTKFWSDNYISRLNKDEKLLFLYLLTNERTTIAGIYELPVRYMAIETGMDEEDVERILKKFSRDKKASYTDGWVVISNFIKYQEVNKSPKIRQGIDNILENIPDKIRKGISNLSIPYTYPSNYINPNPNPNPNPNSNININTDTDTLFSFEDFWKLYPRKKNKTQTHEVFKELDPSLLDIIKKDLQIRPTQDRDWVNGYPVNPDKYLKDRHWEDEITPVSPSQEYDWRSDVEYIMSSTKDSKVIKVCKKILKEDKGFKNITELNNHIKKLKTKL